MKLGTAYKLKKGKVIYVPGSETKSEIKQIISKTREVITIILSS